MRWRESFALQLTDDKFEWSLNYDVHDAIFLTVGLNAEPTDISFDLQFDYPQYPGSRSYVIAHGWLENENAYSFNTKVRINFDENRRIRLLSGR